MKQDALMAMALLALVACGGGDDGWKSTCSATKPCAAGSYCAHTPDGDVCWPDEVDPVINSVEANCGGSTTCRRNEALHVTVDVTDQERMGEVEIALSLDEDERRVLTHTSGNTYEGDISLTDFPLGFEEPVTITVTARDEARRTVTTTSAVTVTRLAWSRQLASVSLWSPAIMSDGRIVVAASNGRLHSVSKAGVASEPVVVSSSPLSGPAAIGPDAIWVGSEDGRLYPVSTNGTVGTSCNAGAAMLGAPAIRGMRAVSATKGSFVMVADVAGTCAPTV
ncbi:MAG TPA: PQQ-binding-like beta-propeller repeat protein, partial [Gemmatimonadaceae bacterium]|nr:PQQ-binding-like beta-propeller repeat protein [Gemmatimonadaceae bacterium]